ncbi:MAG: VanZ family protein [Ruminococcaceae bacterium]|nr:VanZ family protein [Oscillospiraceae bacterium]
MRQLLLSDTFIGMFLQVLPLACLVGLLYAILRYALLKSKKQSILWRTEALRLLFVCYVTGLINLVLVPNNLWNSFWFGIFTKQPILGLGELFRPDFSYNFTSVFYECLIGERILGDWVLRMLIGNALMFVPMGILLPLAWSKITSRCMLFLSWILPLVIELLQPMIGRSFDIDDLLMNVSGILIGYGVVSFVRAIMKAIRSKHKAIST